MKMATERSGVYPDGWIEGWRDFGYIESWACGGTDQIGGDHGICLP